MQQLPLACFLSLIRPPGIAFEDSYLQILPVDKAKCPFVRDHSDITVRLYTRHNPVVFHELKIGDDESLFASNIDFNDQTVFYFTAFLEQPDDGSGLSVREAYMIRGDTNFIIFDLSRLEAGPWYFTAAENTWYIGNYAAKLIDYLVTRGLDLKKTHLVGHSLGAQSAGVAGSVLKSGRVSRITGLDPAFPLFDKLPAAQRLDPTDADFVDVIHTDAGIFGFNRPTGHVDFYPNGGISPQPGCELEVVLHEQRFLNNCDGDVRPLGFYKFSLQTHDTQSLSFENNLADYFRRIDVLKKTRAEANETLERHTTMKRVNDEHAKVNYDVKKESINTIVPKTVSKHKHYGGHDKDTKKTNYLVNNTDLESLDETLNDHATLETLAYNRPKRVSDIDKKENSIKDKATEPNKSNNNPTEALERKEQTNHNLSTVTKPSNTREQQHDYVKNNKKKIKANTNKQLEPNIESDLAQIKQIVDVLRTLHNSRRRKRFVSLFGNNKDNDDHLLFRMLEFLMKNRRSITPVVTVMREIHTLVKNANGELNHSSKERNNYIGSPPPLIPISYDLEIGNESKPVAFVKRLLGLGGKGGKLTINGSGK